MERWTGAWRFAAVSVDQGRPAAGRSPGAPGQPVPPLGGVGGGARMATGRDRRAVSDRVTGCADMPASPCGISGGRAGHRAKQPGRLPALPATSPPPLSQPEHVLLVQDSRHVHRSASAPGNRIAPAAPPRAQVGQPGGVVYPRSAAPRWPPRPVRPPGRRRLPPGRPRPPQLGLASGVRKSQRSRGRIPLSADGTNRAHASRIGATASAQDRRGRPGRGPRQAPSAASRFPTVESGMLPSACPARRCRQSRSPSRCRRGA